MVLRHRCVAVGVALAALCLLASSGAVWAQHGRNCASCHSMHASTGGTAGTPHDYLLKEEVNTLCLLCHDQVTAQSSSSSFVRGDGCPKVSRATIDLAGGDFDLETAADATGNGHSLGSVVQPPGGSWAGSDTTLDCADCHEPHGRLTTNFAILRNTVNGVPITVDAEDDTDWERTKAANDHNAYQSGIVGFCGACHGTFHGVANTNAASPFIRHPQDTPVVGGASIPAAAAYGAAGNAYDAEVPMECATATTTEDVVSVDHNVMCLSCHRAHATSYPNGCRWTQSHPGPAVDAGCNKCHDR